jgi:hypothetical protein
MRTAARKKRIRSTRVEESSRECEGGGSSVSCQWLVVSCQSCCSSVSATPPRSFQHLQATVTSYGMILG